MKTNKLDDCIRDILNLKRKYEKETGLFLGLELDFLKDYPDYNSGYFKKYGIEYIIGSVHYMGILHDG